MFYQDLVNCLIAWFRSRHWRQTLLLAALPTTILLFATILIVRGATLSRRTIAASYLELLQDDITAQLLRLEQQATEGPPVAASPETNPSTNEGQLREQRSLQVPLRRILQLGNSSERAAYIVASQLARQGRLTMAARMMRQIAPINGDGFPPAYAWLTAYRLTSATGTTAEAEILLSDFDKAVKGGAALSLAQLSTFAKLLVRFHRERDALNLLRNNSKQYPQLNVMTAQLAKNMGDSSQYRDATEAARAEFASKRKAGKLQPVDLLLSIQLELIDGRIDAASSLAQAAWKANPKDPNLRRLYSNLLVEKYRSLSPLQKAATSQESTAPQDSSDQTAKADAALPDLRFLELAAQIDPTNPQVFDAIAQAIAFGQELTSELKQALERSIIDGNASGVSHLILANNLLAGDTPLEALPHLRLAQRQLPNSPIVLNNLAYAIMKYDPDNLAEARSLIEQGMKTPGLPQAVVASMLDTLGEIYFTQGDALGAIKNYEDALKLDKTKVVTRKKLVEAYREAGMQDLAQAQQNFLEQGDL